MNERICKLNKIVDDFCEIFDENELIIKEYDNFNYYEKVYVKVKGDEFWRDVFAKYQFGEARVMFENKILPSVLEESKSKYDRHNLILVGVKNGNLIFSQNCSDLDKLIIPSAGYSEKLKELKNKIDENNILLKLLELDYGAIRPISKEQLIEKNEREKDRKSFKERIICNYLDDSEIDIIFEGICKIKIPNSDIYIDEEKVLDKIKTFKSNNPVKVYSVNISMSVDIYPPINSYSIQYQYQDGAIYSPTSPNHNNISSSSLNHYPKIRIKKYH